MSANWRAVTRYEPADFYSGWAQQSQANELAVTNSPVVARGRDLTWIQTPNDHRIAMLIGRQTGFPTQGTNLCKVVIPEGHHSGRQRHGEEAIHILAGEGLIVVDGRRYDFHAGTTIHVPYMSEHQLVNTGSGDVEYISAAATDLDLYAMLGRVEQFDEKGKNTPDFLEAIPDEDGQLDAVGRRIALHLEDAPDEQKRREDARKLAAERGEAEGDGAGHGHGHGHGHGGGGAHGERRSNRAENPHRHGAIYILMGGGESPSDERNGFTAVSVAMTNIFEEVPHTSSHCHSHTEAMLYVLEGVGFSEIDYEHYDWEAGDAVHVPPKMTRHEHFNPSDKRTRTLRIEFGIRYFYEPLWSGYDKVEHREEAIARP
jgi:quercetin dioxygenase-like cupin family protein